jgi:glycosyltransferase involved in cell wall biosynthesis
VEAIASGRPVLAYGRGGALDTVAKQVAGLYFDEQSVEALVDGVQRMEAWLPSFDRAASIQTVRRFAPENFDRGILDLVAQTQV